MTLTAADLDAIRAVLRQELAALTRSGTPSRSGIGALVEGEDLCRENERDESMDPTSTEQGGESSSPDLIAAKLLSRSERRLRPNVLPMRPGRKTKVER